MAIDYKKELENATRSMILVHDPDLLIKMILQMVVQKVGLDHASILLPDKGSDTYILAVSRGSLSSRMPIGLARMDKDDPLVYFFRKRKDKLVLNDGALIYEEAKKFLKKGDVKPDLRQILEQTLYQMDILETHACVPGYFRDELLGLLLLGKKKDGKRFVQDELNFFIALTSTVVMAIRNAQLFEELKLELNKKRQLFTRIIIALAAAIEAKDSYTHGHTMRVTNLSLDIAKRLAQKNKKLFNKEFLEDLYIASLLHDVGKIGISEFILNKEGPLTDEERLRIREHPLIGATILQPIKELRNSILGVKYHHERYDGLGYPEGLKGDQIPSIASIISVADTFDVITTDRPYRSRLTEEEAIAEVKRVSGTQLNPQVTGALFDICSNS